jgi:hypothetical protein
MGQIEIAVTISKQWDSDLTAVCESITRQNSVGNLLVGHEIKGNQIVLKYDKYKIKKI